MKRLRLTQAEVEAKNVIEEQRNESEDEINQRMRRTNLRDNYSSSSQQNNYGQSSRASSYIGSRNNNGYRSNQYRSNRNGFSYSSNNDNRYNSSSNSRTQDIRRAAPSDEQYRPVIIVAIVVDRPGHTTAQCSQAPASNYGSRSSIQRLLISSYLPLLRLIELNVVIML